MGDTRTDQAAGASPRRLPPRATTWAVFNAVLAVAHPPLAVTSSTHPGSPQTIKAACLQHATLHARCAALFPTPQQLAIDPQGSDRKVRRQRGPQQGASVAQIAFTGSTWLGNNTRLRTFHEFNDPPHSRSDAAKPTERLDQVQAGRFQRCTSPAFRPTASREGGQRNGTAARPPLIPLQPPAPHLIHNTTCLPNATEMRRRHETP
jgi:hypothetical protein